MSALRHSTGHRDRLSWIVSQTVSRPAVIPGRSGASVPDRLEVVLAELDRQLEEVREQCSGLATRAGIGVTATAVAAALFVEKMEKVKTGEVMALLLFGVATVAALGALVPTLSPGPRVSQLAIWAISTPASRSISELFTAKATLLEGNRTRLRLMTWAFYLQALLVITAVTVALIVTARR